MCDNSTTVACINKFGSTNSDPCNLLAKNLWNLAIPKNNYLSCTHIPGIENVEADGESRRYEIHTEWKLNSNLFYFICNNLNFYPNIDLFASSLNSQLPCYMSYRPDPGSTAIDSFLEDWSDLHFYAFPPFIIIPRVLQKIHHERATGILIVPDWPSQPWFIQVRRITEKFTILPPRKDMLSLPR